MGMFDDVICEEPLPDGYEGQSFQTKDFECMLDVYRMVDGRLLRRKGDGWEDTEYHGMMCFYTYARPSGERVAYDPSLWHEYVAKYTDGELQEIRTVEGESEDHAA